MVPNKHVLMLAADANILKVLCRKSLYHGINVQMLFVHSFIDDDKSFGGKKFFFSSNEVKVFVENISPGMLHLKAGMMYGFFS